jgi:hypothetical protein
MTSRRRWAPSAAQALAGCRFALALALPLQAACGGAPAAAAREAEAPQAVVIGGAAGGAPGAAPGPAPADGRLAMAPPPAPPPVPGSPPVPAKAVADVPHSAAMLIYTANLSMAVYQVAQGMDAVERIGKETGGYLSVRSDNLVTIRVPRDRFQDALSLVEKLGDVVHRDIKAQDVTDEFVDTEARLKNAYAMRDRLQDLLQKAQVKDAIEIEKELGRVTEEIERLEGRMKLLKDQIAFSTITVSFQPVQDQTVHDTSLLAPFPWLQELGLQSLLNVHQ